MRLLALLFGLTAAITAPAAPSLDDYGNLPEIQQLSISPDGRLVAYRKVAGGMDQVIVVDLEQRKAINALDLSEIKPRDMRFANNDALLLWVSKNRRVEGFRGRFDVSTVFAFNFRNNRISQLLVPGDGVVFPGQSGLGSIVGTSPDGKHLYMPAYTGDRQATPNYSLLKVRLDGSGKPKIQKGSHHAAIDFFVDAQGEVIAREDFVEAEGLHRVTARGKDGRWTEVFSEKTSMMNRSFLGLTRDEKRLVMIETSADTARSVYYTVSLVDGSREGPVLGRDDADIESVLTDDRRVAQGVRYSGFTPSYQFFDEALDARVKAIQASFPDHAVQLVDWSPDWKHIVVEVSGSEASGDYYLSSEGQDLLLVARSYPRIQAEDINPLGKVTFTARDGWKIPTLLTIPAASTGAMQNLPAVVMPHGGPAAHDTIGFDFLSQALAQQGYLVIMPQFRGSTGFGWDHRVAGIGEWGRTMQDDVSDAVAHFAGRGMIDPQRVCIVGASYGGYAALAGGAFTPELYRCVVSINGIADLVEFHDWVRNEQGSSSQALAYWEMQIGGAAYDKAEAGVRSPRQSAANFTAPVLLVHSRRDEIVPIAQSKKMEDALEKQGKPVEYLELEGDDHYLSLGETRRAALHATVNFVNRHLQP